MGNSTPLYDSTMLNHPELHLALQNEIRKHFYAEKIFHKPIDLQHALRWPTDEEAAAIRGASTAADGASDLDDLKPIIVCGLVVDNHIATVNGSQSRCLIIMDTPPNFVPPEYEHLHHLRSVQDIKFRITAVLIDREYSLGIPPEKIVPGAVVMMALIDLGLESRDEQNILAEVLDLIDINALRNQKGDVDLFYLDDHFLFHGKQDYLYLYYRLYQEYTRQEAKKAEEKQSSSGGCYIATAVYGTYDCPELWTLRRFRDYGLAQHCPGRLFIRLYYAVSPTLVRLFGKNRLFIRFFRKHLNRLVAALNARGFSDTPYHE